jgi:pimeloyl-ACP methyl ester carboxylesterase
MFSEYVDSVLAGIASRRGKGPVDGPLATRVVQTAVGPVRMYDSGSVKPCVVMVPDGPNVIEHHERLIGLLSTRLRVVCFDMPGFGFSYPQPSYAHTLEQGANAIFGVLDAIEVERATLAFSCANGFYAMRAAQVAPARIAGLVLSQTPSFVAMRAWTDRVIPWPLRVPVIGQVAAWLTRKKAAHGWYRIALPATTDPEPFRETALHALDDGACFCLAGIVQGLAREDVAVLSGLTAPCTMVWGAQDRSHKHTEPSSLRGCIPQAEIIEFDECGHFPELEAPDRYAEILFRHVTAHA